LSLSNNSQLHLGACFFLLCITLLQELQSAAHDDLVVTFVEDVGILGLLTDDVIANLDPLYNVIRGNHAMYLASIQKFVNGLAFWLDSIDDEVDQGQRSKLLNDIASIYVTVSDQINN
jgi:hypothetical protein